MSNYKWIKSNVDLFFINKNNLNVITINNSGNLEKDFYKYAEDFYNAAEYVMHYLLEEAAEHQDISKLDLWLFATTYLYRHSLELLLKACIFQYIMDESKRKQIIGDIRHDLKQAFDKIIMINNLKMNAQVMWLSEFLSDLSRIDKESDVFRYPFNNSARVFFEKQTHISLIALHDNMNRAFYILKDLYTTSHILEKEYDDFRHFEPKVIIEGGEYYQQSVIGYSYSRMLYYPYFTSYKQVADSLRDHITVSGEKDLVLPMCYLYRNAIELGLKRIIVEDCCFDNQKSMNILRRKKHSIQGLWNSIVDEIKSYADETNDIQTIKDAEEYIRTFHGFDVTSDLFRYPCDKNLKVHFMKPQTVDIDNLSYCFEGFCNFVDGVDSMLKAIREYEAEMLAEMASWY